MRRKIHKITILAVIFILAAGLLAIMFYPFPNRNLELQFLTDGNTYTVDREYSDVIDEAANQFVFEDTDSFLIKEVRIYGKIKSMCLKKINYSELASYFSEIRNAEMQWVENGLQFTGTGQICLIMNDAFQKLLKSYAKTCLMERMILSGLFLAVMGFLYCGCILMEDRLFSEGRNYHGMLYELKKFARDMRQYVQYMVYAARTDLKAEVANSYLNRLWWLLEPFFNMIVYVIVFGRVMGNSVENYATFVFSALLMWNFFNKTINYSVKLVRNNKDIITKVYIPKFVILLSNMILNLFKLLFSLIVLVLMMAVFHVQVGVQLLWVFPAYLVMILLAFGIGMIFLHFGVYVDDLSYAVGILLNMLMFLSGTFYEVMTTLPEPLNTIMICLNPAAMFIDTMRNALLYHTASNLPVLGMWLLLSIQLCGIGIHIVYKNENSYVKVV